MRDNVTGSANILVVEDDSVTGLFIRDTLEVVGFNVELASTARQARSLFSEAAASFDAAIIDIGLPDESGDRIAHEVRTRWPRLPIVMATAVAAQDFATMFGDDANLQFLEKPYDGTALVSALSALRIHPAPSASHPSTE
jgi:DNA-binding response OmpR family regulator